MISTTNHIETQKSDKEFTKLKFEHTNIFEVPTPQPLTIDDTIQEFNRTFDRSEFKAPELRFSDSTAELNSRVYTGPGFFSINPRPNVLGLESAFLQQKPNFFKMREREDIFADRIPQTTKVKVVNEGLSDLSKTVREYEKTFLPEIVFSKYDISGLKNFPLKSWADFYELNDLDQNGLLDQSIEPFESGKQPPLTRSQLFAKNYANKMIQHKLNIVMNSQQKQGGAASSAATTTATTAARPTTLTAQPAIPQGGLASVGTSQPPPIFQGKAPALPTAEAERANIIKDFDPLVVEKMANDKSYGENIVRVSNLIRSLTGTGPMNKTQMGMFQQIAGKDTKITTNNDAFNYLRSYFGKGGIEGQLLAEDIRQEESDLEDSPEEPEEAKQQEVAAQSDITPAVRDNWLLQMDNPLKLYEHFLFLREQNISKITENERNVFKGYIKQYDNSTKMQGKTLNLNDINKAIDLLLKIPDVIAGLEAKKPKATNEDETLKKKSKIPVKAANK